MNLPVLTSTRITNTAFWSTLRMLHSTWRVLIPPEGEEAGKGAQAMASNVGALVSRIGFGGLLIVIIVYYTPKLYSNC